MMYQQERSAVSILRDFDTTKEQRQSFVDDIVRRLDEVHPLDLHLQVKCMESILDDLKSRPEYKSAIIDAADKYPGKKFNHRYAEITKMEAGIKYDYTACGDPIYDRLHASASSASDKVKEREKFLRTIPASGLETVDPITGEMITLYPPVKTSTSVISVKLL